MKKILYLSLLFFCAQIIGQEEPNNGKLKNDINFDAFVENQTTESEHKEQLHNKEKLNTFDDVIEIGNFFKQSTEKIPICVDIDGVVIDLSMKKFLWEMKYAPFALFHTLYARLSKFKKSNDGSSAPFYKDGNPINGVTYQFLYCAKENQKLLPYIAHVIDIIQTSRVLNTKTAQILNYLKEKGHPIIFATNKDHYGYLKAEEALGEEFSSIPDIVVCCESGNSNEFMQELTEFYQQEQFPQNLKNFFEQVRNLKPNQRIHYAPWPKPRKEYWQTVRSVIDQKLFIPFWDDKQENVNGINQHKDKKMQGHLFTSAQQFAEQLIELDILDRYEDKEIFDKL